MDVDSKSRNGRWIHLTATISRQACSHFDAGSNQLLDKVAQTIQRELALLHSGLVKSVEGRWQFLAVSGPTHLPPGDLLATSAAEETIQSTDNWLVAPLSFARHSQYYLTLQSSAPLDDEQTETLKQMVLAVGPVVLIAIRLAATINGGDQPQAESGETHKAGEPSWIGASQPMRKLRATIERVAVTDLPVLILGENGSGKEVASRLIHDLSARRSKPFLAVNCAALSQSLLESELFGHEAGAFTDAKEARAGKFELAAGGTLFLDEIGELSLSGQSKLLRAIEEKIIVRVGGWEPIPTDARIIAATNRDVTEMVREKQFREDLFYRLNTVILEVPALRDRPEDIIPSAEHFLGRFSRQSGRRLTLTAAAKKQLESHSWPGNVRELRNMMERLTFLVDGDRIDGPDIARALIRSPVRDDTTSASETLADATREFQIHHIQQQIRAARGNMTEAARRLGLQRSNLYRKMRQLGMSSGESESE